MTELKELLERETRRIGAEPDALDSIFRARDIRQRNRRIAAAVLAISITAILYAVLAGALRVEKQVGKDPPIAPVENGYFLIPLDGGPPSRFPALARGFWFRFSPDGSRVAFVQPDGVRADGTQRILIMDPDGTGAVQLTHGEFDAGAPAWSDDGRWIAYTLETEGGGQEIAMQSAGTPGEPRVLTALDGRAWYPTWSPDGSMIAFLYQYPNGRRSEIRTVHVTTGDEHRLPVENGQFPDWSPDGQQIVFTSYGRADGSGRVTLARADGSDREVITGFESLWPFWSPDGSLIVFTGYAPDETGRYAEVGTYVYDVAAETIRLVYAGVQAEGWVDPQTLLVSTPGVPNR